MNRVLLCLVVIFAVVASGFKMQAGRQRRLSLSMTDDKDPLLLRAARGEDVERVPVWMMRQAGRHMQVSTDYTQGNMDNTCTVAERSLGDQASSSEDPSSSLGSSSLGSSSLASWAPAAPAPG